jgi:hypothetical protein
MVTVDDRRETVSLIGSDKVEGTAVYGLALQLHFSLEVGTARLGLVSASPQ